MANPYAYMQEDESKAFPSSHSRVVILGGGGSLGAVNGLSFWKISVWGRSGSGSVSLGSRRSLRVGSRLDARLPATRQME
jgi:hypothetical protein